MWCGKPLRHPPRAAVRGRRASQRRDVRRHASHTGVDLRLRDGARNLQGDVQPYRYRMLGQVATLGRYKGVADVLGLRLRGFPGWFVTRSYHLYQLPESVNGFGGSQLMDPRLTHAGLAVIDQVGRLSALRSEDAHPPQMQGALSER